MDKIGEYREELERSVVCKSQNPKKTSANWRKVQFSEFNEVEYVKNSLVSRRHKPFCRRRTRGLFTHWICCKQRFLILRTFWQPNYAFSPIRISNPLMNKCFNISKEKQSPLLCFWCISQSFRWCIKDDLEE